MLAFRYEVHPAGAHHGQKSDRVQTARGTRAQIEHSTQETGLAPAHSSDRKPTALVAGGDRAQRRAHARRRCLYVERSQADRRLVEALGGTKQSPQVRSIPLRALHAHLLHQSCRQKSAAGAQEDIDAGEGGVAEAIWQGLELFDLCRAHDCHAWAPGVGGRWIFRSRRPFSPVRNRLVLAMNGRGETCRP